MNPNRAAPVRAQARIEPSEVVRTAMTIVKRDGLPGLTMRKLASEMDVDPAAFYYHFKDKAAILRAVGRAAIAEIDVPPEGDFDTWRDWIVRVGSNYRNVLLAHPYLRTLVVNGDVPWNSQPVYTAERGHLEREGIPEDRRHDLLEIIHCYVLGTSMVHASRGPRDGAREARREAEMFELGLRVLVDGLVERLRVSS
jgi:AcrR family transcriptional regulator